MNRLRGLYVVTCGSIVILLDAKLYLIRCAKSANEIDALRIRKRGRVMVLNSRVVKVIASPDVIASAMGR